MAENKKSFLLYADLIHTVKKLPEDKAGKLFLTILSYVNDENPVVDDILVDVVFEPVKQQLKRDLIKYETKREKLSDNGKSGGIKSGETRRKKAEAKVQESKQNEANEPNALNNEANEAVNVNVTVNDNVTVTNIKRAKALVVSAETPVVKIQDYHKLIDDNSGKGLKEVVTVMKDFLSKKPLFLEPYVDYWNIAVANKEIPQAKSLSNSRLKKLKTRIREPDFNFLEIMKKIHSSKKLSNESAWFSFDWVFENETNYVKILEGNYD